MLLCIVRRELGTGIRGAMRALNPGEACDLRGAVRKARDSRSVPEIILGQG